MNPTTITYNGEEHSIEEWAKIYGLNYEVFLFNLRHNNFDLDKVLHISFPKRERLIEYEGKVQNLKQWSEELGIPYYCLRSRLNTLKWTVKKAFSTPYEGEKR